MKTRTVVTSMVFCTWLFTLTASAQQGSQEFWQDVSESVIPPGQERHVIPNSYRVLELNINGLQAVLRQIPLEFTEDARARQVTLNLPFPDGRMVSFSIVESPIMAPELAAKFPAIRTFSGQGVDDRSASCRFDITPHGFHAIIFTVNGTIYIDPYSNGNTTHYLSYFKQDARWVPHRGVYDGCQYVFDPVIAQQIRALIEQGVVESRMGLEVELRTYRAAVAATGEYTQFHGGTVELGLAAAVTAMKG